MVAQFWMLILCVQGKSGLQIERKTTALTLANGSALKLEGIGTVRLKTIDKSE